MAQETIIIEVASLIRMKMDLVEYPELSSNVRWVQKGIDILKQKTPRVAAYLGKQTVLARLLEFRVVLRTQRKYKRKRVIRAFNLWIKKEKVKCLVLSLLEAMVIPLTPVLALLPGPNVFFYVPALLLYFHYRAYKGLKRADRGVLSIDVEIAGRSR